MNRTGATHRRGGRRRAAIPYLVLVLSALLSAGTAYFMSRAARMHEQTRFEAATRDARSAIETRIETYLALLRAEAGLFMASREVSRDEFEAFAARLDLRQRYPGIQGVGYSARVSASDLPGLVADMRRQGAAGFHVWPGDPRAEYHTIVFLEPLDKRNAAAIGYDMHTDATRSAAMDEAARTGVAAASGRVTLVQEIEGAKQPGFLIYVPVYHRGRPLATERERAAALKGFVYSPFRAGDLLSHLFAAGGDRDVDVRVYDFEPDRPDRLLFDSRVERDRTAPRFSTSVRLEVASRPWWLTVSSRVSLERSAERSMAWGLLGTGLALSVALFALLSSEVRARDAAERATASLRASEEALHASAAELERVVQAEREAHAVADEANRLKDEFLATLSHELRTPLSAILGWATMLRQGRLSAEQRGHALEVIERNARSQAELVDDLLEVSRIITGKLRLDPRVTDIAPAIESALDSVRPMAEAKGVTLEWRAHSRGRILADPDRIQQIAWNLLSNAIKFTPRGGRVAATLDESQGGVELRVADTGLGIAPAFLPHVFERFRQADSSTTRHQGGLGLGLAIVRHLVEAHGGTVAVESEGEGRGATFSVLFPSRPPTATGDLPLQPGGTSRPEPVSRLARAEVLVVDDEPDARELVGAIVASRGGKPTLAGSAGEALEALEHHHFDLVVADVGMPGVDGFGLIRAVRQLPPDAGGRVPALALTAYGRPEDRARALDAGFQAYLVKPAKPDAIVSAAEDLLGR